MTGGAGLEGPGARSLFGVAWVVRCTVPEPRYPDEPRRRDRGSIAATEDSLYLPHPLLTKKGQDGG